MTPLSFYSGTDAFEVSRDMSHDAKRKITHILGIEFMEVFSTITQQKRVLEVVEIFL